MRTIVTILVMILLVQTTKAQELIFETTTGEIVTKSKFIDPFRKKTYNRSDLNFSFPCTFSQ